MKIIKPYTVLQKVSSTNEFASEIINQNKALNGMIICAVEQTTGKGQDHNYWESRAGENLTFSIITKPEGVLPAGQFILNKITALSVLDFIAVKKKVENVTIKWPNDIYVGNKKIAGILINNMIEGQEIKWSVIGIGININQETFESDAPNPVSLKQITKVHYDLMKCLDEFCPFFENRFNQMLDQHYKVIDDDYLKSLYLLGKQSDFMFEGKRLQATILGIGEFGHLELLTDKGRKIFADIREIRFA